jgi:hypothetical protein
VSISVCLLCDPYRTERMWAVSYSQNFLLCITNVKMRTLHNTCIGKELRAHCARFQDNKATVALCGYTGRAFSKVWTTGLIAKFITANMAPRLTHTTHSYLHNRSFSAMNRDS